MICGGECGCFNPLLPECLMEISDKLKIDIQNNSLGLNDMHELQNLTDEIINNDDLASSGQMLQKIEYERSRTAFFETELPEIFFSYQINPPVLTLSESGAKQLGISRVISDPLESEEVRKIHSSDIKELIAKLSCATADNPLVNLKGQIMRSDKAVDCEYHCRTLWTSSESPVRIGIAGTIVCG